MSSLVHAGWSFPATEKFVDMSLAENGLAAVVRSGYEVKPRLVCMQPHLEKDLPDSMNREDLAIGLRLATAGVARHSLSNADYVEILYRHLPEAYADDMSWWDDLLSATPFSFDCTGLGKDIEGKMAALLQHGSSSQITRFWAIQEQLAKQKGGKPRAFGMLARTLIDLKSFHQIIVGYTRTAGRYSMPTTGESLLAMRDIGKLTFWLQEGSVSFLPCLNGLTM